jgi:dihydrofolate synthase/folylpolyglutamate synthase
MNYKEALDYLYSQLPMFHRIGAAAYKANLDNTIALCNAADNPYKNFRTIHIAGTNGKGSVSNMLASICTEAGLKTGLFTSPHLVDFRERIRVNGQMVSKEFVTEFLEEYKDNIEIIKPSFFEMTFVMAMAWFEKCNVDIAIVETGMGGRLDSTNVIDPLFCVITNIGFDHMQFLGNTLPSIAGEKAGIIKHKVPVVIGESNTDTDPVFREKALKSGSMILFADKTVAIEATETPGYLKITDSETGKKYISQLTGEYQIKNITTLLACARLPEFRQLIDKPNYEELIFSGLKNVLKNTGFRGRWQILSRDPLTVCDIGHNVHGLKYVVNQINRQEFNHLHFVLGVVNDKDINGMLGLLPKNATYYFCKANIPRGLNEEELKLLANKAGLAGKTYHSVKEALLAAKAQAIATDMIFIGGSAFTVAEVL